MNYLILFFVFVIGLIIGSFLNVLIYRLPLSLTLSGRSFCPKCKKQISWFDNIPLFSYLFLKGKCRKCSSPISLQYPIVELATGILFVLAFWLVTSNPSETRLAFGGTTQVTSIETIILITYSLILISSFLTIFLIDLKHQIIPDKILIFMAPVTFVYLFFSHQFPITNYLISSLGSGLFFLILFLATKGKGMGFGDVKFALLIGLILGFPNSILGIYLAFVLGAIFGLTLIILRKKKFGQKIAFGPFLVLGTVIAFFFGSEIIPFLTSKFF